MMPRVRHGQPQMPIRNGQVRIDQPGGKAHTPLRETPIFDGPDGTPGAVEPLHRGFRQQSCPGEAAGLDHDLGLFADHRCCRTAFAPYVDPPLLGHPIGLQPDARHFGSNRAARLAAQGHRGGLAKCQVARVPLIDIGKCP
jgi:hypothetical protein